MRRWYLIIDLEMCRVPKGARTQIYPWANETIQIGAVLMNSDHQVVGKKSIFVSPQLGCISQNIEKLTGISRAQVNDAPNMEAALNELTAWIPQEEVTVVAWSDNDKNQIEHELRGKNIHNDRMEELLDNWTDCQKTFGQKAGYDRPCKLSEALIAAGIMAEGREHDGLDDAYNTALLFAKMETEPKLKLDPIFENARKEEVQHLNYSLGMLFSGLDLTAVPA
ncbi:MAG: exonuclease domain-containing protein [Lachnospiraceae bacterium]|nr:exonuclease domain-containing protein [Lachnospiraceae bacterium]